MRLLQSTVFWDWFSQNTADWSSLRIQLTEAVSQYSLLNQSQNTVDWSSLTSRLHQSTKFLCYSLGSTANTRNKSITLDGVRDNSDVQIYSYSWSEGLLTRSIAWTNTFFKMLTEMLVFFLQVFVKPFRIGRVAHKCEANLRIHEDA